jgi:dipeptidyl aminopeptidase/acylaminoacyl peptidase
MGFEIIFHIKDTNGELSTSIDIPQQSISGVKAAKTKVIKSRIIISENPLGFELDAEIAGNILKGELIQQGMKFPITLERIDKELPGDTSLPSSHEELERLAEIDEQNYRYRVEDYFAKPKASGFQISPNGKFMSYREKDENSKRHIYIKELSTGKTKRIVEEKTELIRSYGWINDDRLFYSMDKGGDENYHIFAVNTDGTNMIDLTPFDGVKAHIQNILKENKDYIIIMMNKNNPQVFEPYLLNIVNGELKQLYNNKDLTNPISDYIFDKDGELRGFIKLENGVDMAFHYKDLITGEFYLHTTVKWDDTHSILKFNYASENKDQAYFISNLDSDKTRIILYDIRKKTIIKEIYSNPVYDVSGLKLSRKRKWEIDSFSYVGEKYEVIPVSDLYREIHGKMAVEFGGKEAYIIDHDDDEKTFLILLQSDKLYGTYYEYDAISGKFTILFDLMPQLKEADMAEMKPISFKSRDGITLYGYITLPGEALSGEKVPLIVNPHGGPQGIRDTWGFNPEAQLFASRGYATLHVNFRISGGYGKQFLRAGFKQIGRKIMEDIEDAVRYVIDQSWVDKDKIAIYGGSHGGYATLMGLVKTPELYTCGVNYVGVSNIFTFYNSMPEYWKPYKEILKQIWYDLDDPQENDLAKEVSPFYQVHKIQKPLFVVQGANDPRVNIAESDQIVSSLRSRGFDVPYMVKYDEGHGFGKEENQLEFYNTMMGFLSKYLN